MTRSGDPDKKDQKLDELSKQHFRQVVSTLDQHYRNGGFELLIVGGYQPEVPRFLDQLTHELRPLVAGTFPIDEHTKASPAEIKQQATAVEQVNVAMTNVSQATKETEVSTSQTLRTASELSHLSRELLRIVQPQVEASARPHSSN